MNPRSSVAGSAGAARTPPSDGRVAVVTGASNGIGAAITRALTRHCAEVHAVGRRPEALHALPDGVRPHTLDLTDDAAVRALSDTLPRVDVLVHCAGEISHGRHADAPVEDLDHQYRINLRAPYVLTQALLPALGAAGGDLVFVNSSIYGHARAGTGQYAATKYGLAAIADAVRDEVNAEGIRVLSVFPGRTATPMQERLHEQDRRPYRPERLLQPEDVAAAILGALELPRTAEVTDLYVRPFRKA